MCDRSSVTEQGCIPFLGGSVFRWENAATLARLSKLAYRDRQEITRTLENYNLRLLGFVESEGDFAFIATDGRAIFVSFRGTNVSWDDLKTDTNIMHAPFLTGKGHRGFISSFHRLQSQIYTIIAQAPGNPLWFTGHSLGGALASVAATFYRMRERPIGGIYTFGAPRVFSPQLAEWSGRMIPATYRMVFSHDLVTNVPGYSFYRHFGEVKYLLKDCVEREFKKGWLPFMKKAATRSAIAQVVNISGIKDHAMDNYVRCAEQNLTK